MRVLLLLGGLGILAGILYRRYAYADDTIPVRPEWLVDHDRRSWTEGIDAPCWNFPIDKVANEQPWRNRQALRQDAERRRA